MLEDYGREAKTNMNKTLEQLKQLQRENKDLNEAVVNSNGRCYNAEVAMNQNIQKLQEEKLALTQ